MAVIYTVEAYSPSLHQTVRQFDLTNVVDETLTKEQAEQLAQQFADVQNRQFYMHVCDWQAKVIQQDVGIHTVDGYLYSR
jgi:hypothetical protein